MMAFDRPEFDDFRAFLQTMCRTAHADNRANAQNLLLEERLPQQREDAYAVLRPRRASRRGAASTSTT